MKTRPLTLLVLILSCCQSTAPSGDQDLTLGPTTDLIASNDLRGGQGAADLTQQPGLTDVPAGAWGQEGRADMKVTSIGGTIQFPCAVGVLSEPLRYDAQGHFAADGTYATGPLARDPAPARFSGQVNGTQMDLTITIKATGKDVGSWHLTYGLQATFPRCL